MAYTRTVHTRTHKASDIEIHLSTLVTDDGKEFTDVREYIVSLDTYGRGITFPSALNEQIGIAQHLEVEPTDDPALASHRASMVIGRG